MQTTESPTEALKRHFGYESFLPLQGEIVADTLAGRDVFAVLPTGGGKSLCYQLPAIMRRGVTVVVSPLIALMKDQVDALRAAGVAATYINSSLEYSEQQRRGREMLNGEHQLLYVAPERVMQPSFLEFLRRLEIGLIAIDEAHCISEWGHDFRPEYRQLRELRGRLPKTPVMALTATATERVRGDILEQLGLESPAVHIGSFNRRSLRYHVKPKKGAYDQLLAFVKQRRGESGIVYCHSRRTTETVAERLVNDGISARAYHAGMTAAERTKHQELFARDEVPVICATIAFGMGINKSNVRYVFHYDMPKSIEGYHQETGRAGRDGLPAECVMLFSPGDAVKYEQFADEKEDPKLREVAREQLRRMAAYAQLRGCRRRDLIAYFGEVYDAENCGGCDNCLDPTPTFDATEAVRKFLACVYRIRERSGFNVGIAHVSAVLAGSTSERVRKFGHDELAAFGAGGEYTQRQWTDIGRQLVAMRLLYQNPERMNAVELTDEGRSALKEKRVVRLAELTREEMVAVKDPVPCDEGLFERLRGLRKEIADERKIPAYMVFSDAALLQMAREYPVTPEEFRKISGVGETKLREFGAAFMGAIAERLKTGPRMQFDDNPRIAPLSTRTSDSVRDTLRRFRLGHTVEAIARDRDFAVSTILGHLAIAAEAGESVELTGLLSDEQGREISEAFRAIGWANITGVREMLEERYDYGLLKLYRAVEGPRPEDAVTVAGAESASLATTGGRTKESPARNPVSAPSPA